MSWSPITESGIWDLILAAEPRMTLPQQRLWEVIRRLPQRWAQDPWGNEGGGFWVVAIFGNGVIWYNDIEYGFNLSRYCTYGAILDYWCNQDDLEDSVQQVLNLIEIGKAASPYKCSPPISQA
ncbi:hypothetical protein [Parachitinimonas caeni]|uniref:Uncharacterized protein n=1 Tax=Parachitinimonas caeni TaxID=3031301 RepID=A0ABT7DZ64_9NEIS|nr:hypothetical protein [Parachitinimonas caeni]MDK2125356.1 hypothetical protein [Parachitinimonas caeni]